MDEFLSELRASGYEPVRPLVSSAGRWERLMYNGEKPQNASGGYKLTTNPDGSLFATYGSQKDPEGFRSWRTGGDDKDLNWDEIAARKVARESHRAHLAAVELARQEKIARMLTKAMRGYAVADSHPYLERKGIGSHGAKIRPKTGELLIPRYGADGKMWSIQRISQSGWKGYFKGALSKGLYYPIAAKDDDRSVIIVCEGFATGATIREATGKPVVVAFDAGGLGAACKIMREKYPNARIIVAADNDQWSFGAGKKRKDFDSSLPGDAPEWEVWRSEGRLYNTGLEKGKIAGTFIIAPDFPPDDHQKRTDWNDMAAERGLEYVRDALQLPVEAPVVTPEESAEEPLAPVNADKSAGAMGMNFQVLGYNEGVYYYYPFAMRQIVALSAGGHSMQNLLQLDSLEAWEGPYRDPANGKLLASHGTIALMATAMLTQAAEKKGVFVEEDMVRGAGAWLDEGRVIFHCGDTLYVEGEFCKFSNIRTDFTYVAGPRLVRPARDALSNSEAHALRKICEAVSWENPLSGSLLAGWLVIAPICSALQYRPHIYITGEAESGKSTVIERIIKPVLGRQALRVDGGTTEPAIRDMMRYDGRPLVYDEAEPSPSMHAVIELARKASTGSTVKKYGQRAFKARFCACFSAINPPVSKTADESRISFMVIKKNRRTTAQQEYEDLLVWIEETITDDFAERLLARTLENMNALLANMRVFQRAFRKFTGGARASQQIGTMLAGLYMLGRKDIISEEAAIEWVSKYDWGDHTIVDDQGDPMRLVQHIAASLVRFSRTQSDVSIGELVAMVHGGDDSSDAAHKLLRYYGIAVHGESVDVASRSQNLARLLRDTDWGEKWNRTLGDVPGAVKKSCAYFSRGVKTSAVSLPISLFIEEETAQGIPDVEIEI